MYRIGMVFVFFINLLLSGCADVDSGNSKYFVFIGEKISLDIVQPKEEEISFDEQYLVKYKIIKPYIGSYSGKEIEFTVFDHYGPPAFSKYKHVLLYVVLHEGKYYHSKYMFSPLYKTKTDKWAGTYSVYDYSHSYNKNTTIKPRIIDFSTPVVVDITDYDEEQRKMWFPEPYYKIEGNKALAVYGNSLDELFLLRQNGVLKARGDFQ